MAGLYRLPVRRGHGGTVRVTVEVPASVVTVLVAAARANGVVGQNIGVGSVLPRLFSWYLCDAASLASDYIGNEGFGVRCWAFDNELDDMGFPFPQRVYDVAPDVRGTSVASSGSVRPWWLTSGRRSKKRRYAPIVIYK